MATYSAITKVKDRKRAEGLGIAFEKLNPAPMGVGVFELEDGSSEWEVGAYFDDEPDGVSILILENAFEATGIVISEIPETDWVSKVKRELSPVEAGRFFVFGDHDSEKLPQDRVGLLIEASMAFGTGHHGTTKGCLLALDCLISKNKRLDNVIDIGCGTAVLAMAVGKVSSSKIIASDVDRVAVEVALANLKANKLQNRIDCLEAMGFENELIKSNAPFDLIFANILKPPLIDLAPSIRNYLKSGGHAIVSGILDVQASEIIEVYHQNNLKVLDRIDIGEWVTLTFI
ncbi:tRNA (adenine(22)-N(1))-methyltransferase TrmK [Paracoccaceae bacterium]|nr:tRNA (adenine(22)-N(1))-methyltransferase TrmK [Paracoccaceae bacterium]